MSVENASDNKVKAGSDGSAIGTIRRKPQTRTESSVSAKDTKSIQGGVFIGLKPYHNNPRKISEEQYKSLKRDLVEFGDLGGVVHDLASGEIICGNQRISAFKDDILKDSKITLLKKFHEPTKTGTIAVGHIEYKGELYSYRQVLWTKEQCAHANVISNQSGGEFDFPKLFDLFGTDELIDMGFGKDELLLHNKTLDDLEQGKILLSEATVQPASSVPTATTSPEKEEKKTASASPMTQPTSPEEPELDEGIQINMQCPRCEYGWHISGLPKKFWPKKLEPTEISDNDKKALVPETESPTNSSEESSKQA